MNVFFSITITTAGKKAAIAANAIEPLVSLVDDETSEVRANSLKVSLSFLVLFGFEIIIL